MKQILFLSLFLSMLSSLAYGIDCDDYLGSQNRICRDAGNLCETGCQNDPTPTGVCSDDIVGCMIDCASAREACYQNAEAEYNLCIENQ